MGKKKKRKKNKNKYSKTEFLGIVCAQCRLCEVIYDPWFCYEYMYKSNPKRFIKQCYGKLMETRVTLEEDGFGVNSLGLVRFKQIFCASSMCNRGTLSCEELGDCFANFANQTVGVRPANIKFLKLLRKSKRTKAKRKADKKKNAHVFKPYPTFFTNASEEWMENIKKILEE